MNDAIVISAAAVTALLLFPLHIDNYLYINADEKYAGLNITLYRIFKIFNANTVKNSIDRMQVNGKDKKIDKSFIRSKALKIYNNLSITKIIQLGDYGVAANKGAYAAVIQNALTQTAYSFAVLNGGRVKLKNYIILNKEHGNVVYYAKISGVINMLAVLKIIFILLTEKLNEQA